ncbi:Hypothetical protein FSTVST1_454 [Faustovirus ST1]|nr:Hypothetical protein FSTVST1_454 [Faustovirus ST1]
MDITHVMVDIAFNEIVKWNPSSWLCVSKKFTARVVEIVDAELVEAFDWPFWRNIRILWTNSSRDEITKRIFINNYVDRVFAKLKLSGDFDHLKKQHIDYYNPLAKYIIDTLLVTGECLAAASPVIFNFIRFQLNDLNSALNNDEIVDSRFNGKIIKVLVECYSSVVEEFIVGGGMISSMRVVRAIRCAMEGKQDVFTDNAFTIIDDLVFQDHKDITTWRIKRDLQRHFESDYQHDNNSDESWVWCGSEVGV